MLTKIKDGMYIELSKILWVLTSDPTDHNQECQIAFFEPDFRIMTCTTDCGAIIKAKLDEYLLLKNEQPKQPKKNNDLDVLDRPIEHLGLPRRVLACLKAEEIFYIRDLMKNTSYDLLKISNFAKVALLQVKTELARFGLFLEDGI